VLTHFSSPETISSIRPNPQLAPLGAALELIIGRGLRPQWLHAGNSSSMVAGSDRVALMKMAAGMGARLMLRPGLALYGYLDRIAQDGLSWDGEPGFAPVLEWKAQVTSLRTLQAGETAGYGNTFTAARVTRLALLPVGYADGFNRLLSNRGHVLVRGHKAAIAGRISMDQTTVDVTDIRGNAIGDEVVLLGKQGRHSIGAWDLADLADTIPWEVLCAISSRVPRKIVT
jgi:alanine racemase